MTTIPSPTGGEAAIFTWLADKVFGGAKRAFDWGWDQAQWAAAQDRYDQQVIRDYGEIRIFGQTIGQQAVDTSAQQPIHIVRASHLQR